MTDGPEPLNIEAELIEHDVDINDARAIAEQLMREGMADEVRTIQRSGNPAALQDAGRRLATFVLARLDAPGEIALHEQVFEMAFEMVNADYSGSAADNL